jgi:alkanesulfonate monooxygenase SsuD/methylene tetrahydromethanopterin reductase-like flavin-dependent oxidoreductase (luciferase family)
VQRGEFGGFGPPLMVGGAGDAVLRIAAEHAQNSRGGRTRERWGYS